VTWVQFLKTAREKGPFTAYSLVRNHAFRVRGKEGRAPCPFLSKDKAYNLLVGGSQPYLCRRITWSMSDGSELSPGLGATLVFFFLSFPGDSAHFAARPETMTLGQYFISHLLKFSL
jgi:hypothetical protein